jgi:hypothetical protein
MANLPFYTDIALAQNKTLADASKAPSSATFNGRLCISEVTYTVVGTEVATDYINLVDIPSGARVLPHLSTVVGDAAGPGTTLTGDFGHDTDPDAYGAAQTLGGAMAVAGKPWMASPATAGAEVLVPVTYGGRKTVRFTITAAAGLVAGRKLRFIVAYRMPN